MPNFLFDKEIINNHLSVLDNTLSSQRQTKKTLLSYLEKFSDAMYENFNSEDTDYLLFLINEAHSIFECIKSNIKKTIELKKFLESIYNSELLNTINSENFTNDFNNLLENISKTNSNYLTFMNNYETFIKPPFLNKLESDKSIENLSENSVIEIKLDSLEPEEESLFETISHPLIFVKEKHIENKSDITINKTTDVEKSVEVIDKEINIEPSIETIDEEINIEPSIETIDEEINIEPSIKTIDEEINIEPSIKTIDEEINIEPGIETIDEEINIEPSIETFDENVNNDITTIDNSTYQQIEDNIPSIELQENELIINKKLGIAILPYTISDLDELFLDDPEKYSSIQDIIDKEYTVKLKDFENSSITRYKVAFKLAKEKCNYSFSQAANFAKQFLIESEVTALIIASCKTIEELEFYIECLNNNNLKNFHYFKIIEK